MIKEDIRGKIVENYRFNCFIINILCYFLLIYYIINY